MHAAKRLNRCKNTTPSAYIIAQKGEKCKLRAQRCQLGRLDDPSVSPAASHPLLHKGGVLAHPRLPLMRELSAKLTEGETPVSAAIFQFLSLRQKSKIFDTSLVRGRHEQAPLEKGSQATSSAQCAHWAPSPQRGRLEKAIFFSRHTEYPLAQGSGGYCYFTTRMFFNQNFTKPVVLPRG